MANEIDTEKLDALEALLLKERERRASEEPLEIITGVPDADDDGPPITTAPEDKAPRDFSARRQVSEALSAVSKPMPSTPAPRSVSEPADLVDHPIWAQVAPPSDTEPGGVIVEGSYTEDGGVVRVYDADHGFLGTERLSPGADAGVAARRRVSRALWYVRHRWQEPERSRWRHREA